MSACAAEILSADNPAGENLEYDSLYLDLENLASTGQDTEGPSEETSAPKESKPAELQQACEKLWQRTRDFRVAVFYTIALTSRQGFAGMEQGLNLLCWLTDTMWEDAWPRLDPDDDLDPTERLNIFSTLSPENSVNDPIAFLNTVRSLRLCPPVSYSVHELLEARGILENKHNLDINLMGAELQGRCGAKLTEQTQCLSTCLDLLSHLEDSVNGKIQDGHLTLAKLKRELTLVRDFFSSLQPAADSSAQAEGSSQDNAAAAQDQAAAAEAAAFVPAQSAAPVFDLNTYTIKSRSEALTLIARCSDYFTRTEPTSPVPFLLQRALRMADMNFIDLLAEIDNSAVERGREQLGVKPPAESSSDNW